MTPPTAILEVQLLVLAKQPLPGRVKTRLTPPLSPQQAAEVARACLLDTLAAAVATPVRSRALVLDGSAAGLPIKGFEVRSQIDGTLGDRLAAAFATAFRRSDRPVLLIGMDTPQVTPELLAEAARALLDEGTDAVLGRAHDGGWWLLGLAQPAPSAFEGVPMSQDNTGDHQLARLAALGLTTRELAVLRDVDHAADLLALTGELARSSALAALLPVLQLSDALEDAR